MSKDVLTFGWINNPHEVDKVLAQLKQPEFKQSLMMEEGKDTFLYQYFRKVVGTDPPKGPQKIGDCVSWAWGNLVNYVAALQIYQMLIQEDLVQVDPDDLKSVKAQAAITQEYQEALTEAIYGFSRVEVGHQNGSMNDGSVGAWAADAVQKYGTLSRPYMDKTLGEGKGTYDPKRAKAWGAAGVPNDLEPTARTHLIKTVSRITKAEDAAAAIQNGYPVAICSDQGFTMTRNSKGFCAPQGVWYHAMLAVGVRFDVRGFCISQSWGPNTPNGPTALEQPDNTFWAPWDTVARMLSQGDSFTGSTFEGYPAQDFIDWSH